jgi:hypothetical protein
MKKCGKRSDQQDGFAAAFINGLPLYGMATIFRQALDRKGGINQ